MLCEKVFAIWKSYIKLLKKMNVKELIQVILESSKKDISNYKV